MRSFQHRWNKNENTKRTKFEARKKLLFTRRLLNNNVMQYNSTVDGRRRDDKEYIIYIEVIV